MDTSNPTPQPPTGPPDEIVSSENSPTVRRDATSKRAGLWSFSFTAWSVLAVVAVLAGGVAVVQWINRSDHPARQDASLSGFQITIPEPSATQTGTAVVTTPTASGSASPSRTPEATKSGTPDNESTGDAGQPAVPSRETGAPVTTTTTNEGTPDTPAPPDSTTEQETQPTEEEEPEDDGPEVADPSVNLAASGSTQASSQLLDHVPANVTDGNADSYWESLPGLPQTLTVDLGKVTTVGRLTLSIPPGVNWRGRTQVIAVHGSSDGNNFSQVSGAQEYRFGGRRGSSEISIGVAQTPMRYLRLTFTDNGGWPSAQLGHLAAYSS